MKKTLDELGLLHLEIGGLEEERATLEEALAEEQAKTTLLRTIVADLEQRAHFFVDELERIADDFGYYLRRSQFEMLPDITAQVEVLLADMRGSL